MTTALAPLLRLADVGSSLLAARVAADAALGLRAVRSPTAVLTAEVGLRAAVASAALEGHPYELDEVRAGTVTHPVVQGALRVSTQLPGLAGRWNAAPRQVLARLHVFAARGCVPDADLGRPLLASPRFDQLCDLVMQPDPAVPALLRAAVVHGELLALRPFAGPSGVVARAAARLCLMADGLDVRGVLTPEVGHRAREPEYVGSANAFSTGTPDGVRAWIKHVATAVEIAASELAVLADAS